MAVPDCIDGAEAFTDDRPYFIPDSRATKLRKLAGEYEIDGERHSQQPRADAGVSLIGCANAAVLGERLGDHA